MKFENDVLISWDTLIMDTDFHKIKDFNGKRLNENQDIYIGDNVWIGCRKLILKGASIPGNYIIAANSTVVHSFESESQIIGGNPGKVLRDNVMWER